MTDKGSWELASLLSRSEEEHHAPNAFRIVYLRVLHITVKRNKSINNKNTEKHTQNILMKIFKRKRGY